MSRAGWQVHHKTCNRVNCSTKPISDLSHTDGKQAGGGGGGGVGIVNQMPVISHSLQVRVQGSETRLRLGWYSWHQ